MQPVSTYTRGGRATAAPAPVRVRITSGPLAAGVVLALWSLAYLARQTQPVGTAVASPVGDFALEGVALALAWLVAVVACCLWAPPDLAPSAPATPNPRSEAPATDARRPLPARSPAPPFRRDVE